MTDQALYKSEESALVTRLFWLYNPIIDRFYPDRLLETSWGKDLHDR